MRQVQAERIEKANPKMKLNVNVSGTADPPSVHFEFADGDKVRMSILNVLTMMRWFRCSIS
jgi:hypothetical protein